MSLRGSLVRLAHENPGGIREHLLPILRKADSIGRPSRQRHQRLWSIMNDLFKRLGGQSGSPREFFREAEPLFKKEKAGIEEIYWVLVDMGYPRNVAEDYAYEWAV